MSYDNLEPQQRDQSTEDLLTQLSAEHLELKERVRQLQNQTVLTEAEKLEYTELKKMKLKTKDRIRLLQQR